MKVGIIGVGAVGSACALALLHRDAVREIVLVDINTKRAKAIATDMRYGTALFPTVDVRDGSYAELRGADLIMITAGINEKTGGATNRNDPEGRLKLLDMNVPVYQDIVTQVVDAAPQAILMVVTDPPDPLADLTRHLAHHDRVISTGTMIDTLRLRWHLADRLGVSPQAVDAISIGEHGTSEVLLWSSAQVAGIPIRDAVAQRNESFDKVRDEIENDVRFANITIIEGNNASQYGIGMVCARLAQAVLRDERVVLPVGSYQHDLGVTLSLPSVIGGDGVIQVFRPSMSADELAELQKSAGRLRVAHERLGIRSQLSMPR
jgi:L-lactate dehydrogenase